MDEDLEKYKKSPKLVELKISLPERPAMPKLPKVKNVVPALIATAVVSLVIAGVAFSQTFPSSTVAAIESEATETSNAEADPDPSPASQASVSGNIGEAASEPLDAPPTESSSANGLTTNDGEVAAESEPAPAGNTTANNKGSETITVPKFVGLSKSEAMALLRKIGITTWSTMYTPSSEPKDTVVWAFPAEGSKIKLSEYNDEIKHSGDFGTDTSFAFKLSSGANQDFDDSLAITSPDSGISWTQKTGASWGFYEPEVSQGFLKIKVDAKFDKDTEILLSMDVAYALVNSDFKTGFAGSTPTSVKVKANNWSEPIPFNIYLKQSGVSKPSSLQIRLRLKDADGTRIETLTFKFPTWQ